MNITWYILMVLSSHIYPGVKHLHEESNTCFPTRNTGSSWKVLGSDTTAGLQRFEKIFDGATVFLFEKQISIYFHNNYLYIHPGDVLNREATILSVLDESGRTLALIALGDDSTGKEGVPMGPVLPERIIFQLEKGHVSLMEQVSLNELVSDSTL